MDEALGTDSIDEKFIIDYITHTFSGVEMTENFGYTFFFYGADHTLPFASLSNADKEYDQISNLDRPGVFRLNIGISRSTFQSLFGTDKVDVQTYDYTVLDAILPHPEYAAQSFVCVLNPSRTTFDKVRRLLDEAYDQAVKRDARRKKQ